MTAANTVIGHLAAWLPALGVVLASIGVLWAAHVLLIARHRDLGSERLFPRQLTLLGLSLLAVVIVALSLPVSSETRGQVMGLIGLVLSAVFAFSSGTIFANLMAGLMLRVTRPFHTGDYIRVQTHFGRVVQRGLLDTEVQTEHRELLALPNTYLIANPVAVVRSSGAIISSELSLGYDVHHGDVETALLQAARDAGLEDGFVRVLALGDFAIGYRVSGLLADTQGLLSAQSALNCAVLDALHGAGIEILSPSVMAQRPLAAGQRVMPAAVPTIMPAQGSADTSPEDVVFDKAEDAARAKAEASQASLLDALQVAEHALDAAAGPARAPLAAKVEELRTRLAALAARAAAE